MISWEQMVGKAFQKPSKPLSKAELDKLKALKPSPDEVSQKMPNWEGFFGPDDKRKDWLKEAPEFWDDEEGRD